MSELPYIILDEALTDLTEIVIWYEKQSSLLSDEFLLELYFFLSIKYVPALTLLAGILKTAVLDGIK